MYAAAVGELQKPQWSNTPSNKHILSNFCLASKCFWLCRLYRKCQILEPASASITPIGVFCCAACGTRVTYFESTSTHVLPHPVPWGTACGTRASCWEPGSTLAMRIGVSCCAASGTRATYLPPTLIFFRAALCFLLCHLWHKSRKLQFLPRGTVFLALP